MADDRGDAAVRVRLEPGSAPTRLDRALVAGLARQGIEVSRSQLARSFAAGTVTVDGRPVAPSERVTATLEVAVELVAPPPLRAEPEAMDLVVVYEDDDVLVLDKPAGVLMHPTGAERTGTLVSGVLHHLGRRPPPLPGNFDDRPGVVHRIDRDTSGLVVFAKHERAAQHLAAQFRSHRIERRYLAVGHGRADFETRRVETLHGRDPRDRRRFSPQHGTRRAESTFRVLARGAEVTAFEVRLATGRTHQVRMHARHLGHPLVGDPLYGRRRPGPFDRDLGRHALHAQVLGFEGLDGRWHRFSAPPPEDLRRLLDGTFPAEVAARLAEGPAAP